MSEVKEQVREFYETVGWRRIGEGLYQNARYEDLRPVARQYLRRCHLRVARHLPASGKYLLDAGSGPIQYPEYLEYSKGFQYRVCLDLSRLGLAEARQRIGPHGLFVVGDVAHLPFVGEAFEATVSLHTIHHLPPEEHRLAFQEFLRALRPGGRGVVVYSWGPRSGLMRLARPLIAVANRLRRIYARARRVEAEATVNRKPAGAEAASGEVIEAQRNAAAEAEPGRPADGHPDPDAASRLLRQPGTYTFKHDYGGLRRALEDFPSSQIRVWRAVSTQFLRSFVHPRLQGERLLRLLYWLEERLPRTLGRHGQYPMIIFDKPGRTDHELE